ncbi:MAG: HAD-IA family hydrolase [SAR202 cluster bacterium]|nr:HAD-IA family hydrolase [SAR202 cluster bacterium]
MDSIHFEVLNQLLSDLDASGISEEERIIFNQSWHWLSAWEDVKPGLHDLKQNHVITTLSNGNYSMLLDLAKNADLPWDCILSTELFGTYKPDPRVYIEAISLLGCEPEQTLMVASHSYDLDAAKSIGIKTCYVYRPDEFGCGKGEDSGDTARFDVVVDSFTDIRGSIL